MTGKGDAFGGETFQIGSLADPVAIERQGLGGQLIGHDQQNVGLLGHSQVSTGACSPKRR